MNNSGSSSQEPQSRERENRGCEQGGEVGKVTKEVRVRLEPCNDLGQDSQLLPVQDRVTGAEGGLAANADKLSPLSETFHSDS